MAEQKPLVGIIMGSKSDMPAMEACTNQLDEMGVPYELVVYSAHRTPMQVHEWASTAAERGMRVIIAAAGKAAALPGVVAAVTPSTGHWRPHEDERPGWPGLLAFHGADAFRRARRHGCHRRGKECRHPCGAGHGRFRPCMARQDG